MKSIITIVAFGIIALCLVNCSYIEKEEKNVKCKQDYFDSIIKNNEVWKEGMKHKDISWNDVFKATQVFINDSRTDCETFKKKCDTLTLILGQEQTLKWIEEEYEDSRID